MKKMLAAVFILVASTAALANSLVNITPADLKASKESVRHWRLDYPGSIDVGNMTSSPFVVEFAVDNSGYVDAVEVFCHDRKDKIQPGSIMRCEVSAPGDAVISIPSDQFKYGSRGTLKIIS